VEVALLLVKAVLLLTSGEDGFITGISGVVTGLSRRSGGGVIAGGAVADSTGEVMDE
jgi:hypothetical protein